MHRVHAYPMPGRLLAEEGLSELFGIDLAEAEAPAKTRAGRPSSRRAEVIDQRAGEPRP